MKNEFVPYDIALAMKELGFDEPCFGFYSLHDDNKAVGGNYPCDGTNNAPLYQQAFRWFRDEYNLFAEICLWGDGIGYSGAIKESENPDVFKLAGDMCSKTYEEAQDACLRKLIEIVKDKL